MPAAEPCTRLRHPQALGELLIYRLGRLYATAGAMTIRVCEGEFGIPRREWRLLAVLGEAGALQPSVLAARAELDRARTSRALAGLQAKGLVDRQALANDRRLARVDLTEQGRALHARMLPRLAAINGAILGPLGDDDVARLDGLLTSLQQQATELLGASDWPKADRRRGGRRGG
ncbi:MAG: MarR family winged helix-turn-helix transcriptional regulator [Betaproteobacteria bacterium]|jgi:DNA-binding MarR family transcriptional regulator|nr:MarR family transcriptional regulator [Rubrivivax sp.]